MVRLRCTYRARRRPPTHLLDRPRWATLRVTEVARPHRFKARHDAASVTGAVRTGAHSHHWRLGFKQSSLGHIARVSRHPAPGHLRTATTSLTCSCPLALSRPGKSGDPRTSLRVHPDCVGDTTERLTAHTRRATRTAPGSPRSLPLKRGRTATRSNATRSVAGSCTRLNGSSNLRPLSAAAQR